MHSVISRARIAFAIVAVLVGFSMLGTSSVSAHEHRTVATDYTFVVGFINEPAISGDTNGIELTVTKGDAPVEGLEGTLKARVIFGDQTKDIALTPAWQQPGVYEAVFIPTAPGDYTFHFTGTVESATIDETFTSSPEGFDSVADRAELEFPVEANGSVDDRNVAMPVLIGLVVLVGGALFLVRRRAVAHPER
jgi:hypothetical protein